MNTGNENTGDENAYGKTLHQSGLAVLRRAHLARVHELARNTPLDPAPSLSARLGRQVLLKREDLQPGFSFKLRGAYNLMSTLSPAELARGVIAASAGNHAQGVVMAAVRLNTRAVIVMPHSAPRVKIEAVRRLGGSAVELVLAGDSFSEAEQEAWRLQAQRDLVSIPAFDHPEVIAGQATVGLELLQQHPAPAAVFVPVGGGGLLAGVAACIKTLSPSTRVIGVQAEGSSAMIQSLKAGYPVRLDEVDLFSDGTAVKQVGVHTLALCREHADLMLEVSRSEICAAIRDIYQDTRCLPEPAGALALAGLRQAIEHKQLDDLPGALIAIVTGANMNFEQIESVSRLLSHTEIAARASA